MISQKYTSADQTLKRRIIVVDSFQQSSLMVSVNVRAKPVHTCTWTNLASNFQTFGSNFFYQTINFCATHSLRAAFFNSNFLLSIFHYREVSLHERVNEDVVGISSRERSQTKIFQFSVYCGCWHMKIVGSNENNDENYEANSHVG
jgi:hypothetical protein